jgi:transcriptional regulator with XRE-family HTH domain
MDPAGTLRRARESAGLSIREVARRAGTSHAAVVAYEQGAREPRVDTFERLLRAMGLRPRLELEPIRRVDPERAGRLLEQVLDLADALPHRAAARRCPYPRFPA